MLAIEDTPGANTKNWKRQKTSALLALQDKERDTVDDERLARLEKCVMDLTTTVASQHVASRQAPRTAERVNDNTNMANSNQVLWLPGGIQPRNFGHPRAGLLGRFGAEMARLGRRSLKKLYTT